MGLNSMIEPAPWVYQPFAQIQPEPKTLYQIAVKNDLPRELRKRAADEFRSRYHHDVWGREKEREKILANMCAEIDESFPPAI